MPDVIASTKTVVEGEFSVTSDLNKTLNWLRRLRLTFEPTPGVSSNAGTLDLSEFHVRFTVTSATGQSMSRLEVRIYNLADATAVQLNDEYNNVTLEVGYKDGGFHNIFQGEISQFRRGRENGVDGFVEVTAFQGDDVYNWGIIHDSIPATRTDLSSQFNSLLAAMEPYKVNSGVPTGKVAASHTQRLYRGKVMYGMIRDHMRAFSQTAKCQWNIYNGTCRLVDFNDPDPNIIDNSLSVVLTPKAGLIGVPEQTMDGVTARLLLDPKLYPGTFAKIPTTLVATANTIKPMIDVEKVPGLDLNGTYIVYSLQHSGDTRGNTWYSDIICVALNSDNGLFPNTEKRADAVV